MASLVTSLNASLAAGEAARLAQAQQLRFQEDLVAQQLRLAAAQQGLPPNSTITASYKFSVGIDGSLTPTETRITTQSDAADEKDQRSNKSTFRQLGQLARSSSSLQTINRPRPELSPSDEIALFASSQNNGNETIAPETTSLGSKIVSLAARAQQTAANLYARNSDAIYNVNPLIYEAV